VQFHDAQHDARAIRLGLAVVAAIAVVGVAALSYHSIRNARHRHDAKVARQEIAVATTAAAQIRVPASYARYTADCQWFRCYRIDAPSTALAADLPAVLTSTGATFSGQPTCTSVAPADRAVSCYGVGVLDHQRLTVTMGPYVPSRVVGPSQADKDRREYYTRSVVYVIVGH
jgi:hypothetical protein